MDNPAYVTMFFRKSGRDVGDNVYSHDTLLHYRRVWCWQELSAVCDDPVPSESV